MPCQSSVVVDTVPLPLSPRSGRSGEVLDAKLRTSLHYRDAPASLRCVRCLRVLQTPMQTGCGHRYCKICTEIILNGVASTPCLADGCHETICQDKMFPDKSAEKEINALVVSCRGQSCNWEGRVGLRTAHEKQCQRVSINRHLNCVDTTIDCGVSDVNSMSSCGSMDSDVSVHDLQERMREMENDKAKSQSQINDLISLTLKLSQDMREMKNQVAGLQAENVALRREVEQARTSVTGHNTHLKSIDRSLALNDIGLTDLHFQVSRLDQRLQDGVLVWKIDNFSQCFQDAKTNKTAAFYSPPFYTSPCGYKLCARVYLNGDGSGKGSHISLFLVVMRGEYDAVLPWPFQNRVTFSLIDQDSPAGTITESFCTDPSSSSFLRPTSEVNVASGIPRFVSHSMLKESHMRGDTIFLRVQVDSGSIASPDRRM